MKNDPNSYHALVGIHRTAVAVSALIISMFVSVVYAADPPTPRGNVSVNVNPTTGYYSSTNSTLRLPNGVSASPSTGVAPVVSKYPAGLQQTIPTGITIDAIKKSAPLPAVVRASTPKLKSAAKGLFRGNLAGLVLGAGLNSLLDGIGALIEDGQVVQKIPKELAEDPQSAYRTQAIALGADQPAPSPSHFVAGTHISTTGNLVNYWCLPTSGTNWLFVGFNRPYCVYMRDIDPDEGFVSKPMSSNDIDDAVDSSYTPEPSDWTNLTPHLDLDDVEITWAPTLEGEPVTTTVFDADGNPYKVTETNIWYDFDIRDNPSPQPALDMKTREETKTYEDGVLTGTTTTESTAVGGSGGAPAPEVDIPIDCDLFPTACAWFDWTQEEPTEPDDDLSPLLQEVPIVSETYTITGGVAACPAPMVLDLSVFGSREVSYQPLCDLASTMKYLYLALMSFAAAVLLNRSINRV